MSRASGINAPRVGVQESLGITGGGGRVATSGQATDFGAAARSLISSITSLGGSAIGALEIQQRARQEAIELEAQEAMDAALRGETDVFETLNSQDARDAFSRGQAWRDNQTFDPDEVPIIEGLSAAESYAAYHSDAYDGMPEQYQTARAKLDLPIFAKAQRDEMLRNRDVLWQDSSASTSGSLATGATADALADLSAHITLGESFGLSRGKILGSVLKSPLRTAAINGDPNRVDFLETQAVDESGDPILVQEVALARSQAIATRAGRVSGEYVAKTDAIEDWAGSEPEALVAEIEADTRLTPEQSQRRVANVEARRSAAKTSFDVDRVASAKVNVLIGAMSMQDAMAQTFAASQLPADDFQHLGPQYVLQMIQFGGQRQDFNVRTARVETKTANAAAFEISMLPDAPPPVAPEQAPEAPAAPVQPQAQIPDTQGEIDIEAAAEPAVEVAELPVPIVLGPRDDDAILGYWDRLGGILEVEYDENGKPVLTRVSDPYSMAVQAKVTERMPTQITENIRKAMDSDDQRVAEYGLAAYATLRKSSPNMAEDMLTGSTTISQIRAEIIYSDDLPAGRDQEAMNERIRERMPLAMRAQEVDLTPQQSGGILWREDPDQEIMESVRNAEARTAFEERLPTFAQETFDWGSGRDIEDIDVRVANAYATIADTRLRVHMSLGLPTAQAREKALDDAAKLTAKLYVPIVWADNTTIFVQTPGLPVASHYGPVIMADLAEALDTDDIDGVMDEFRPTWNDNERAFILIDDDNNEFNYRSSKTGNMEVFISDPYDTEAERTPEKLREMRQKIEARARRLVAAKEAERVRRLQGGLDFIERQRERRQAEGGTPGEFIAPINIGGFQ